MASPPARLEQPEAELVFGLVGAVGTDLSRFQTGLVDLMKPYGYVAEPIRLSDLIKVARKIDTALSSEYERIKRLMSEGTELRKEVGRGDIVAVLAIREIFDRRPIWPVAGGPEAGAGTVHLPPRQPVENRAYILNSLKNPEEVSLLRRVYGPGFFLIGVYVPEEERVAHLTKRGGMSEDQAKELIRIDQDEGDKLGQNTSDVFHRADVFVRFRPEENTNKDLERFLDLVFGDPFQTPTADEHAMFLAFASSLRSASLSRQVGAVLVSRGGEVIGVGANDVPCHGGGLYWPGTSDRRDHVLGYDSNDVKRNEMLLDVASAFKAWLDTKLPAEGKPAEAPPRNPLADLDEKALVKLAKNILKETSVVEITEFGRAVHAEMEALLSSARSGISPRGATLYCTTFPCHNCAKHLVAAGVERVVYVEPYPKSQAKELHSDAISFDRPAAGKVSFEPFVGVGPRRYFDLFAMKLGRGYDVVRKRDALKLPWEREREDGDEADAARRHKKGPRVPMLPSSYIHREDYVARDLEDLLRKKGLEAALEELKKWKK